MKTRERIVSLSFLIIITLSAFSHNTFEKVFDELGQSEIRATIETSDNAFLLAVCPFGVNSTSDYVLKISSQGDVINSLNCEVAEGCLKYFGLFKHPHLDDIFIIPALIFDGQASTEIAILLFDKDLNFIDEKRSAFSDVVQDMAPIVIPSATIYDDEMAITAHVVLKNGGYGHLYTRINLDGERLAMQSDDSYNVSVAWTSSIAIVDKDKKNFAVLNTKIENDGAMSLHVEIMDSTMSVYNTQKVEFENNDNIFILYNDTPVLKQINDSTIIMDVMVSRIVDGVTPKTYHGNCLMKMNHELEITGTKFYFYDKPKVFVRLPLRNSFDMQGGYILTCDIINAHSVHPSYKTQCLVTKYDTDMNVLWERFVNQEEGYYYPHYVLATKDGGCLIAGYSYDDNFQYKYSYALKTDADGNLGINENYDIDVKPYSVYPIPASDNIYIELSTDFRCQSMEIYTLDGHLVMLQRGITETVNISGLAVGVYVMKLIMSDGSEFMERIVKGN